MEIYYINPDAIISDNKVVIKYIKKIHHIVLNNPYSKIDSISGNLYQNLI